MIYICPKLNTKYVLDYVSQKHVISMIIYSYFLFSIIIYIGKSNYSTL